MRNPSAAFVLVALAALAGCGLIKKTEEAPEAGATAAVADAAAAAPAGPTGKNAAMVTRFPTAETAVNDTKTLLQPASPHTALGTGTKVADLKTGTVVTRVATHSGGWSLVVFPDPNVPTDQLMGWVNDMAFTTAVMHNLDGGVHDSGTAVDAGIVGLRCPPGQDAIVPNPGVAPVCKKTCTKDSDCKHSCQTANNNQGKVVKACMSD